MYVLTYPRSRFPAPVIKSGDKARSVAEQSIQVKSALARPQVQAKVVVGAANDRYEQEADRVADEVMGRTGDAASVSHFAPATTVQRICQECEEELQRKPMAIDSKSAGGNAGVDVSGLSGGRPLSEGTRSFFEPRLGADFSNVRVHTENDAAQSARSINAKAYTWNNHIVFNDGEYAPESFAGRHLLAHELTHVIQQSNRVSGTIQRSCSRTILAEGTCEHLACNSKWACEDDANGVTCPDGTRNAFKETKKKYRPLFTCDVKCENNKTCDDTGNWAAVPPASFTAWGCGAEFTVCANGKKKKAVVRDKSITRKSYEVSPGIQTALGVTPGSSFKGAIYKPGADQSIVDKDSCCKVPTKTTEGESSSGNTLPTGEQPAEQSFLGTINGGFAESITRLATDHGEEIV